MNPQHEQGKLVRLSLPLGHSLIPRTLGITLGILAPGLCLPGLVLSQTLAGEGDRVLDLGSEPIPQIQNYGDRPTTIVAVQGPEVFAKTTPATLDPDLARPTLETGDDRTGDDRTGDDRTADVSQDSTVSSNPDFSQGTRILQFEPDPTREVWLTQAPFPSDRNDLPTIPETDPNRDRFPQPLPPQRPSIDGGEPVLENVPTPGQSLPNPGSGVTVEIQRIEVVGSSIYSPEALAEITEPYGNQALTLEDLQQVADQITQRYLNDGYITSRAVLVDQEIVDGVVQIQVIEGSLAEIRIEGTERLSQNYIKDRINLGAKTPLRTDALEDQLRLLRVDPNIANLEASLRASDQVGQSILSVRIVESPNVGGSIGSDNYSPESVGGQRTRAEVYYRNIMGNGETISGSWDRSYIGGSDVFRLTYRMPVNARNGTVQFQTTIDRNEITQVPFDGFDISGETERYDFTYRQPIIRNPRQEFALSLSYTYQDSQTFVLNTGTRIGSTTGAEIDGTTRTSVVKFGQDYVRRDASGAWAFQSQFSFGNSWLGSTTQDGDIPDSQFFSWLSQGQRVQRVNDRNLLIIQGDLQFASGPMLGSQQFVIGGGQSVRGYRQNARAADSGWRFSVEDRFTVRRDEAGQPKLQLAPFFDAGLVWNYRTNPNGLSQDTRFLAGAGLGLIWQPLSDFNVRVDYGIPLVGVSDRGNDSLQSRGLYFTLGHTF